MIFLPFFSQIIFFGAIWHYKAQKKVLVGTAFSLLFLKL